MKKTDILNSPWPKCRSVLAITIAMLVIANLCDVTSAATIRGSMYQAALSNSSLESRKTEQTVMKMKNMEKDAGDVCLSSGCIHTASMILKNMDTDVDPCDNFYKFACGGFRKDTVIPDDQVSISAFHTISNEILQQLRKSIENKLEDKILIKPFRLITNLYKSCINETAINEVGLEPFKTRLRNLGGWPVVDGDLWNSTDFDWKRSTYKFRDTGYSVKYLINFSVITNPLNSTKRIILLDTASLGLFPQYLSKGMDNKIVQAYYSYMVDVAVILGAKRERAIIELKESLLFEIDLAGISRLYGEQFEAMNISELRKNYPSIHWQEYLNGLLSSSTSIDENEIVIVSAPGYLSDFEKLIAVTPKRVQANYVMWRTVMDSASYLNKDIREIQLGYAKAFTGKIKRPSRWKECVSIVSNKLPISAGAMYVREHFNEKTKHNAEEMVKNIQKEFKIILNKVEWMDNVTRQSALEKAASMTTHVAYPNELLDDKKLEEFYAKLELTGGNYLESVLNVSRFQTENSFSKLHEPVNKSAWINHEQTAVPNAFYFVQENSIHIPAGILRGAFFDNDRPRYMNYGAMGYIIGHEITHGFDNRGRQYDKDGNLVDWWAPSTKEEYLKRVECMINQYDNYTVEEVGLKVNGITTRGENIADNGGIKEAYLAYNEWADENSPETKLPGLPYSPKQMFWIGAANSRCWIDRPENLKLAIITDSHSPEEFRIIGPFSNMPEFSQDFNCPIGSRMNPVDKCSVW